MSEHQILKETNTQLNNHLDELKENNAQITKKYKGKKEYNKKLLDLLKIQGFIKFIIKNTILFF